MAPSHVVQGVQSSEDLLHSRDLEVVAQELLHLPGPGQLLLDLLGAGQVVVDGGRLHGQTPLHHQPGVPLCLGGILVRVVAAPHVDHTNLATVYHQSLVLHRQSSHYTAILTTGLLTLVRYPLLPRSVRVFLITKTSGHCRLISNSWNFWSQML